VQLPSLPLLATGSNTLHLAYKINKKRRRRKLVKSLRQRLIGRPKSK
jgi:hypothetical protein